MTRPCGKELGTSTGVFSVNQPRSTLLRSTRRGTRRNKRKKTSTPRRAQVAAPAPAHNLQKPTPSKKQRTEPKLAQKTLTEFMNRAKTTTEEFVLFWSILGVSHRKISHPLVQKMLASQMVAAKVKNRHALKVAFKQLADKIRSTILKLASAKTVLRWTAARSCTRHGSTLSSRLT